MDNESEGIWSHIMKNSPSPEHDEISQLIGKKLIDDNQNLWRESLAIKSIVTDLSVPRNVNMNVCEKPKVTGKRSILTAKSFSSLHDDGDSKSPATPGVRTKKIQNISRFTLESIVSLVVDIRRGLENENSDLEMEVDRLNREMESQAESVFTFNGNNKSSYDSNSNMSTDRAQKSNQCKLCGVKLYSGLVKGDPPLGTRTTTSSTANHSDMCDECDVLCLRRDEKLLTGNQPPSRTTSFSTELTSSGLNGVSDQFAQMSMLPPLPLSSMNNNQRSSSSSQASSSTSTPRSGSNGATSSRFRSRLNTARDELFFLDEF